MAAPHFSLGQPVATPGALALVSTASENSLELCGITPSCRLLHCTRRYSYWLDLMSVERCGGFR